MLAVVVVELVHHRTCLRMDFPIATDHPTHWFAVVEQNLDQQHRRSRQCCLMRPAVMQGKDLLHLTASQLLTNWRESQRELIKVPNKIQLQNLVLVHRGFFFCQNLRLQTFVNAIAVRFIFRRWCSRSERWASRREGRNTALYVFLNATFSCFVSFSYGIPVQVFSSVNLLCEGAEIIPENIAQIISCNRVKFTINQKSSAKSKS